MRYVSRPRCLIAVAMTALIVSSCTPGAPNRSDTTGADPSYSVTTVAEPFVVIPDFSNSPLWEPIPACRLLSQAEGEREAPFNCKLDIE